MVRTKDRENSHVQSLARLIRHEQDAEGVARRIAVEAAAICNVRLDDPIDHRSTETFGEALRSMAEELIRQGRNDD